MVPQGLLWCAVQSVKDQLVAMNLQVVTDPRNIRPYSVFVELPTVTAFTYNVGDVRIMLHVCAPPPGNQDASDYLITVADQIMDSDIAVTDLRPGFLSTGGQDMPTYDLTVAVSLRRN